jgi:ketosteroid isomerase-like protein
MRVARPAGCREVALSSEIAPLLVGAALVVAVAWAGPNSSDATARTEPGANGAAVASRADADRAAILAHIRSIFQAYVDRDRAVIEATHSADWTGFQGPSTRIERGLADYMVNADRSLAAFRGTGYELVDTEVQLHGDVALVYYVARYDYLDAAGKAGSLGLRSLDVYRRQPGGWIQCGSHITPLPAAGAWGEGR